VTVRDGDYTTYCGYDWHDPGTIWGLTVCNSLTGTACNTHTIRFDTSYFSVANSTDEKGLAVHEHGHALGLTHRDADSGSMITFGPYPVGYTGHDLDHLNNDL
jgi:hypothetical protein